MLGTKLASRLGLPTTPVAVIHVGEELIRFTPDLCIEMPHQRIPCKPGLQFGSRYPGDPRRLALLDFLPDPLLEAVANLYDFQGMLVFDKWTCNTNGRQTLFFRSPQPETGGRQSLAGGQPERQQTPYTTVMIDQGFCFNAGEWNFPDAPLRGLYARNRVYQSVTGCESFAPWLERLEKRISEQVIAAILEELPPEWYADDFDALRALSERLLHRRERVRDFLLAAKNTNRQPFPNWI